MARGTPESSSNTRASGSGRLRRPPSQPAHGHTALPGVAPGSKRIVIVSVRAGRFGSPKTLADTAKKQSGHLQLAMTDFIYSTELRLDGPWLIDAAALTRLGAILDEVWREGEAREIERINAEVESVRSRSRALDIEPDDIVVQTAEQRGRYWRKTRSVKASLGNQKWIQALTMKEAQERLDPTGERVTALECSIEMGDLDLKVSVTDELSLRVSPETAEYSRKAFGSLRQWAQAHQAPMWQRIWVKSAFPRWVLWLLAITMSLPAMSVTPSPAPIVPPDSVEELLAGGITQEELPRAVELLLRTQVAPRPPAAPTGYAGWWVALFWIGLLANTALLFHPTVVLGFGAGPTSIRRWRVWMRIVGVSIPSMIAGSIVVPYIADMIGKTL